MISEAGVSFLKYVLFKLDANILEIRVTIKEVYSAKMEIIIFFASWPTIYLLFALLFDLSKKQPFKSIQISTMKEIAFVLDNFSL